MSPVRKQASPAASDFLRPATHELGNLLLGIRLTAHFLAGEATDAQREQWGADVELLATQAGAWNGILRPLVEESQPTTRIAPAELLDALHRTVFELVASHGDVRLPKGKSLPEVQVESEATHQILVLLTTGALAEEAAGGVKISAREEARHVVFSISDAGGLAIEKGEAPSLRGRALVYRMADTVLKRTGGRVRWMAPRRGNRFDVWLKKAPKIRASKRKATQIPKSSPTKRGTKQA